MQYASEVAQRVLRAESTEVPGITRFWRVLTSSPSFVARISEFMKLGRISIVMVGGSVEDERTFSAMNFVKDKLRNRLDDHLELCVRFKTQSMFGLRTFPFTKAIKLWRDERQRRG